MEANEGLKVPLICCRPLWGHPRFCLSHSSYEAKWADDSPRKADVPGHKDLYNPLLSALKEPGGSGSIEEIPQKVIDLENIPDEVAEVLHPES